jgi:hypothetical protein
MLKITLSIYINYGYNDKDNNCKKYQKLLTD